MAFMANSEGREPGARRRKIADFLKAANDARQTYFQGGETNPTQEHLPNDAFPDASIVSSGDEEMILFPSYARKYSYREDSRAIGDAENWHSEWARHANKKAVVEVEVRGWVYMPQKGPATRRQRLMIGLARQLSGIAAPTAGEKGREDSPERSKEEDLIQLEAEQIISKGQVEAEYAGRGAFSEKPGNSRTKSADDVQSDSGHVPDGSDGIKPLQKRDSWAQPAKMSVAEMAQANKHLLHRLRPFMATPLVESPVKVFFYNDTTAREKTVFTNPSGHFTCLTTLDFVPTHVRILAGVGLSATEEVHITTKHGVSLISDIDDTIKHSAISAGAREIFRNAFIRDLGDLTIDGVREWYTRLHDMGVKMHYVSNSPWQMYPILTSYFKQAGLPQGSFHLKQYSGMLQGIFEPVAERKKSSLDRIMRDFPSRKFILVGDSGEADLEVYTDVVLEHPNRVLAVFIRDVTSTTSKIDDYFTNGGSPGHRSRQSSKSNGSDGFFTRRRTTEDEEADFQAAIAASLADQHVPSSPLARAQMTASPDEEEDLIDLSENVKMTESQISADSGAKLAARLAVRGPASIRSTPSPAPPKKPDALRGSKQPPPLPMRPSTAVKTEAEKPPPLPARRTYREIAKDTMSNIAGAAPIRRPVTPRASTTFKVELPRPLTAISPILGGQKHPDMSTIPDLTPQRRVGSSGSLSALRNRMSSTYSDDGLPGSPGEAGLSKKEFLWMQRLVKARSILDRQGVVLKTWKVGSDAEELCVRLVQDALKEMQRREKK